MSAVVDELIGIISELDETQNNFVLISIESEEASMRYELEIKNNKVIFYNDEDINKCFLSIDGKEEEITYDDYDKLVFITDAYYLQELFIDKLKTYDPSELTMEKCISISDEIMIEEYGDDWTKEEVYCTMYKHSLKSIILSMAQGS